MQGVSRVVLAAEHGVGGPSAALVLAAALALALVHVFGKQLTVLDRIPRSRWLSGAGGVSVAYVFVHVLPELEAGGRAIEGSGLAVLSFFEHHVYLVALVGFIAFYGLELFARERQTGGQSSSADGEAASSSVFWVHVGSFAIYNGLIGRLLGHQEDLTTLLTFTIAIGLHFVVNDFGLREIHGGLYHRVGRWLLAGAILVGAVFGVVTEIDEALFATVFALIAGGIVLNVIKEELPEERESRFWAFAGGAVAYTILLIAI